MWDSYKDKLYRGIKKQKPLKIKGFEAVDSTAQISNQFIEHIELIYRLKGRITLGKQWEKLVI